MLRDVKHQNCVCEFILMVVSVCLSCGVSLSSPWVSLKWFHLYWLFWRWIARPNEHRQAWTAQSIAYFNDWYDIFLYFAMHLFNSCPTKLQTGPSGLSSRAASHSLLSRLMLLSLYLFLPLHEKATVSYKGHVCRTWKPRMTVYKSHSHVLSLSLQPLS